MSADMELLARAIERYAQAIEAQTEAIMQVIGLNQDILAALLDAHVEDDDEGGVAATLD